MLFVFDSMDMVKDCDQWKKNIRHADQQIDAVVFLSEKCLVSNRTHSRRRKVLCEQYSKSHNIASYCDK